MEEDVKIGIIVGVLVGVLFFVLIVVVIVYCYCGKSKPKSSKHRTFSREGLHLARPDPIKTYDNHGHFLPHYHCDKDVNKKQLPKVGSSGLWVTSSSVLAASPPQRCRCVAADHRDVIRTVSEPQIAGYNSNYEYNMRLIANQQMPPLHEVQNLEKQAPGILKSKAIKYDSNKNYLTMENGDVKTHRPATQSVSCYPRYEHQSCEYYIAKHSPYGEARVSIRPLDSTSLITDNRASQIETEHHKVNNMSCQHCKIETRLSKITESKDSQTSKGALTPEFNKGRQGRVRSSENDERDSQLFSELRQVIKKKSLEKQESSATSQSGSRSQAIEPSVSSLVDLEAKYITSKAFQFLDNYLAEDDEMCLMGTQIWNDCKDSTLGKS